MSKPQGRPPKKKHLGPPTDPTTAHTPIAVSSSVAPEDEFPREPTERNLDTQADSKAGLNTDSQGPKELPMPNWLASRYTATTGAPLTPPEGRVPPARPSTKMAASSFKPKRRKRTTPVSPDPPQDDPASDTTTAGQTGRGFFDDSQVSPSRAINKAAPTPKAGGLSSDEVDRATSTAGKTVRRGFFDDSQLPDSWVNRTGGQALESGDLSPEEVDRNPGLTPEADDVIDVGVGSVTPPAATLPETESASIDSDELLDMDIASEGYEGIYSTFFTTHPEK